MARKLLFLFALFCLVGFPLSLSFSQVSEEDILRQIAPEGGENQNQPLPAAASPEGPPPEEALKGDLEAPFKVTLNGNASLNYVFAESPDSFIVNYKVHLEGLVRNKVDIIKGKGRVTAEVKGFLAKWPTGECLLKVGVGEFPFETIFSQVDEEKVRLDIKITEAILESWESNCKFIDAPGSKFNTRGNSEKWFDQAFRRTAPSLKDIQLPIDRLHRSTTTMDWKIERFLVPDPPLGSVEMEGKGTIAIIPES